MTSTYEKIVALCKAKGIAVTALERELGFGRGSIGKMKNGNKPSIDRLEKIANYFSVSITHFTGGGAPDWQPAITDRDEKDIKKAIDAIKNQLSTGTGLMYDGEPMDEESMEAVLAAIEVAERTAVLAAKKKFTPNKYRK